LVLVETDRRHPLAVLVEMGAGMTSLVDRSSSSPGTGSA
jgi:hypothetical protein